LLKEFNSSSVGKEPLSLEVSLGVKCVTPAHAVAAVSGADRAVSTHQANRQGL